MLGFFKNMIALVFSFIVISSAYATSYVSVQFPPVFLLDKIDKLTTISMAVTRCPESGGVSGVNYFREGHLYQYGLPNQLIFYYEVSEYSSEGIASIDTIEELALSCAQGNVGEVVNVHVGQYQYDVSFPDEPANSYEIYVGEYRTDGNGDVVSYGDPVLIRTLPLLISPSHPDQLRMTPIDYDAPADRFKYSLESPVANGTIGGIGVLRGWACWNAARIIHNVSYQIDDFPVSQIPYGSGRNDTKTVCDGKTENGFATVVNWNRFGNGEHTLKLFVNDELVEERTFTVFGVAESYQTDLSGEYELEDFPAPGQTAVVRWSTAAQDFVLVSVK